MKRSEYFNKLLIGTDCRYLDKLLETNGFQEYSVRYLSIDFKSIPVDTNIDRNRINVHIENKIITKVEGFF